MIMIPKQGRDHTKVKAWRPIGLANVVGKLGEKLIAQIYRRFQRCGTRRRSRGGKREVQLIRPRKQTTWGRSKRQDPRCL